MAIDSPAGSRPPINELLGFLQAHRAPLLEELRTTYPEYASILRTGKIAGPSVAAPGDRDLRIRAEVALLTLKTASSVCADLISQFQRRLKRSTALEMSAQICGLVTSATLLATLAARHASVNYSLAGVNFAGAVLSLFARHLSGARSGDDKQSLLNDYQELVECKLLAAQISAELSLRQQQDFEGIPAKLIEDANAVAGRIGVVEGRGFWVKRSQTG